jgi:hypothetical protein
MMFTNFSCVVLGMNIVFLLNSIKEETPFTACVNVIGIICCSICIAN